jgi:hypothetical protein
MITSSCFKIHADQTIRANKSAHHLRWCIAISSGLTRPATPSVFLPLPFLARLSHLLRPWPAPGRRSRRRHPRRPRPRRPLSARRCFWRRSAWWACPSRCRSATDPPTPASSTPPASTPDTVRRIPPPSPPALSITELHPFGRSVRGSKRCLEIAGMAFGT